MTPNIAFYRLTKETRTRYLKKSLDKKGQKNFLTV